MSPCHLLETGGSISSASAWPGLLWLPFGEGLADRGVLSPYFLGKCRLLLEQRLSLHCQTVSKPLVPGFEMLPSKFQLPESPGRPGWGMPPDLRSKRDASAHNLLGLVGCRTCPRQFAHGSFWATRMLTVDTIVWSPLTRYGPETQRHTLGLTTQPCLGTGDIMSGEQWTRPCQLCVEFCSCGEYLGRHLLTPTLSRRCLLPRMASCSVPSHSNAAQHKL